MPGCVGAAGWGIEREGVAVCVYCKDAAAPRRGGIFTVLLLRPSLCSTDNIKKLRIILKLILHSICILN